MLTGKECNSLYLLHSGRSPLFGHFSTTLLGLDTIRAYGAQETFTEQVNSYQDAHSRAWYTYMAAQTWLNVRLEMLTVLFLAFVAFVSTAMKGSKKQHTPIFVWNFFFLKVVIQFLLGTLRSDNGDVHENVAEKQTSHHFKLFRDYANSPCY